MFQTLDYVGLLSFRGFILEMSLKNWTNFIIGGLFFISTMLTAANSFRLVYYFTN